MSKVADIRRRTAEKMAQPAHGQRPIKGCEIPAHIRQRLDSIRIACELRVAERKALEAEAAQHQETDHDQG